MSKEKIVSSFNNRAPVGEPVLVRKDDGTLLETVTTSEAYVLSGHTPVVHVEGISGCYLLERVTIKSEIEKI